MKIRTFMGTLLLGATLVLGGCATNTAADPTALGANAEINHDAIANDKAAYDGWVDDVFAYVKKNASDEGVLVEVTGHITKGSESGTETELTLIGPDTYDAIRGDDENEGASSAAVADGVEEIAVPDDADRVVVYFAEPVPMTKWTHLTTVRGMAFYDSSQPHLLVIRGAIEVEH